MATAKEKVQADFLCPSSTFDKDWLRQLQPEIPFDVQKLAAETGALPLFEPRVRLSFSRRGLNGDIAGLDINTVLYKEIQNPGSSMAITRRVSKKTSEVKGKSGGMPFTPSGMDIIERSMAKNLHRSERGLLDIAPGLSRGAKFASQGTLNPIFVDDENEGNGENAGENTGENASENADSDKISSQNPKTSENEDGLKESQFSSVDSLLPNKIQFVRELEPLEPEEPKEKSWAHMVDINKRFDNFSELVPNPARTWPFELDNFQKEAVYRLEQGDSVFVAAHTSAGKTVIAEYAMSLAAQHMTRCIYTSPIKALSNQKYRDFKTEYDDVGILTGDVQVNPDATTLIMTTEILRSMLYRGADIIRDVEYIVFDEVHYVNDSERGVVWEEVIIMLPEHVKLILLSATVPNTFEFANWVGRTKQKDVYVISTSKRPVPLTHSVFVDGQLYEVVDKNGEFNKIGYSNAKAKANGPEPATPATRGGRGGAQGGAQSSRGGRGGAQTGRGGRGGRGGTAKGGQNAAKAGLKYQTNQTGTKNTGGSAKNELLSLAHMLRTKELIPAVFFVFSRKKCEEHANNLLSVKLNTGKEEALVHMFINKAVQRLSIEDRNIPQIAMLTELLKKGIGIHHSGLLPILKEVVEILFARGLVKILFATETFAMGLNLPTRTVVFTEVHKFDSKSRRELNPSEYTQMAGRAGRRGLDKVGTVILMRESKKFFFSKTLLQELITGKAKKLSSQFRLTYQMILSLLRIESLRVEDVLQQSFIEDETQTLRPMKQKSLLDAGVANSENKKKLHTLLASVSSNAEMDYELVMKYHTFAAVYMSQTQKLYEYMVKENYLKGKLHYVMQMHRDNICLAVLEFCNETTARIRLVGTYKHLPSSLPYWPQTSLDIRLAEEGKASPTVTVPLNAIVFISKLVFKPADVENPKSASNLLAHALQNEQTLLQEIDMSKLGSIDAQVTLDSRSTVGKNMELARQELLLNSELFNRGRKTVDPLHRIANTVAIVDAQVKNLESTSSNDAMLLPEYEQRINVLKKGGYINENMTVALKGRVACEISTGYELYLTELIMENFWSSYEPEEIVALLSCFIFDGTKDETMPFSPKLESGKDAILAIFERVNNLASDNNVTLTDEENHFAEKNHFALMEVIYEWARGMSFSKLMELTTVHEGLIVRVINRLDELCRAVMSAARIIGEVDLYDKLAIAQEKIRRDIVFCSSLYI